MRERISLMTFGMEVDVAMKKMTVKEIVEVANDEGIKYVDMMQVSDARIDEYIEAFNGTDVKPYVYIGRMSFFSNSEEKIKELLHKDLETTKKLGTNMYMLVPIDTLKDEKICTKMGREKVKEVLIKYFNVAVSMAKDMGITVCVETTPQDYSCLSGKDDCKYILENVDGLKFVFDTANCLPHGDDPIECYEELKEYICHVHVKDVELKKPSLRDKIFHSERAKNGMSMKCCLSGTGVIPLKELLNRLERDGYSGKYALEYSRPEKFPAYKQDHALRLKEHMKFFEDFE